MNRPTLSLGKPDGKAILLLAYGSPESRDDIPEYLTNIRGGRPPSPELIRTISDRYQKIGGSPLLSITTQISRKVNALSGKPVYVGMRHWHPFISDTVLQMAADGVRKLTAVCLAPHYSELSIGAYHRQLKDAVEQVPEKLKVSYIQGWPTQKEFLAGLEHNIRLAINRFPAILKEELYFIFSAHSLPRSALPPGDPYTEQLRLTANLLAKRLGIPSNQWQLAYQSAPPGREGWLTPDINQLILEAAEKNQKNLVAAPIGFLTDHLEVLYDLDIQLNALAQENGIRLERMPMLNDSPHLISALANLADGSHRKAGKPS